MKKRNIYIITNLLIVFSILGLSIGYSAFNNISTIKNISANIRVPSNIRVTNFNPDSSTDKGLSTYTDYSISSIMTGISLPNENSSVKYKVTITNFEGPEMGISSITGLPENLTYELTDYSLKQKICNAENKCSLGVTKEFYITIKYKDGEYNSTKTKFDVKLNLEFNPFYTITYVNISNTDYPTSIIKGDSFSITLPATNYLIDKISRSDGTTLEKNTDYTLSNSKLTVKNVDDNLTVVIEIARPIKELILEKYTPDLSTPNYSVNVTTEANSGLFTAKDESGNKSHFFRGVINDNYVSFANKLWRIIRINGDGSCRLILEGTAGTSMFYTTSSKTVNNTNYASSTIKTYLENWYTSNIQTYENYIDKNAIFWSDRTYSSETTTQRFYNGRNRILSKTPTPTLVPVSTNDMFSVSGASKGNGLLAKSIGLITADEVVFAGGSYNSSASPAYYSNEAYYLYTDLGSLKVYGIWTMTPNWWNKNENTYSTMIVSKPQAVLYYEPPGISARSVRPVINLKSTVLFSGVGTQSDPYNAESY